MLEPNVILNHSLVPKHEILSKTATEKLLKEYNLTKDRIPKILPADPAVQAIGAKRGDILRITRDSLTAGEAVYYRLVA